MQDTPKLTELQAADLTPDAEETLQAAAAAVGGYVLEPGTGELVGTVYGILSTVEDVLELLDAELLPPIIQDRLDAQGGAA